MQVKPIICLLLVVLFGSCIKDRPIPGGNISVTTGDNGVFITNEGNFQFGNAAVSFYADGMSEAVQDLFQPANNRPLGDVCQSMYMFNHKAYLVINNSAKIEVVNAHDFNSVATITGLQSPRYFLPVSNGKAYVTDLYANTISIVDLNDNTVYGTIPCGGKAEELLLSYGNVFVTNNQRNYLLVIRSATDIITDSITIGYGANSIREDKNGMLWVLCSGRPGSGEFASLHKVNPLTKSVESTFTFAQKTDAPWRLAMNGTNDTLYFLNKDCFRMSVTDQSLPLTPIVRQEDRQFYGLGINPYNGNIYLSDAIDYVQRGKVFIYDVEGVLENSFLAGIIPGNFYFK